MEQALAARHRHQRAGLRAAARLAVDEHARGISTEGCDIVAHPFQRGDDILHSDGARRGETLSAEFGQMEETQRAQPVGDRDDHAVGKAGHRLAVHADRIARPAVETTAVQHDDNRFFRDVGERRRPQIEGEIVLARARRLVFEHDEVGVIVTPIARHLRGGVRIVQRAANARPFLDRLRRHETVRARSGRAVANPQELGDPARHHPAKTAIGRFDHRKKFSSGQRARHGEEAPSHSCAKKSSPTRRKQRCHSILSQNR